MIDVLESHRLFWKLDSLCYMRSSNGEVPDLYARSESTTLPVKCVEGMEVLGAWIQRDGATQYSFWHRSAKAEKEFWADSSVDEQIGGVECQVQALC